MADLLGQGFCHGVAGFTDGDDDYAGIRVQVVEIFADAHDAALGLHMAGEGFRDGGFAQGVEKNFARGLAHSAENIGIVGSWHFRESTAMGQFDLRERFTRETPRPAGENAGLRNDAETGFRDQTVPLSEWLKVSPIHFSIASRSSRRRPSKKWLAPSIITSFFGSGIDDSNASNFARGPN